MVVTVAVTIAVLAVLIFIHELGHFLAARAFDIRVPRFSIGLGPRLFGFRRGETEYRISALPIGGYVKVAGMKEMSALEGSAGDEGGDDDRSFAAKSPGARAVVLAAGVAMNAVLAVVLFALVAATAGVPVPPEPVVGDVVEEWLPPGAAELATVEPGTRLLRVGDRPVRDMDHATRLIGRAHAGPLTLEFLDRDPITIRLPEDPRPRLLLPFALEPISEAPPVIGEVTADGPAARAGILPGDRVVSVEGNAVDTWQTLTRRIEGSPGVPLNVEVEGPDGERRSVRLVPEEWATVGGPTGRMGAKLSPTARPATPRERKPPLASLAYGVTQSRDIVVMMGDFVAGLADGRHSARELGGPVMIGQLSGMAARAGLPTLLTFVALLSINLAVINLLPIPALDGGHLLLLGIEVIRGRPTPERLRLALGRVGTVLVIALMLWAVASDVLRILGL